jgi:hypothetical protein
MPLTPYGKAERDSARRFVRRHYRTADALLERAAIRAIPNYLWAKGMLLGFEVIPSVGLRTPIRVWVKLREDKRPRVWEFC